MRLTADWRHLLPTLPALAHYCAALTLGAVCGVAGVGCVSTGADAGVGAATSATGVAGATLPAGAHLITDVPFYPDTGYRCGPVTLAGVLGYWGVPHDPDTIAAAIYSPGARGTLAFDMCWYARQQGLQAGQSTATVDDLRRAVDAGVPVIVMVDLGIWKASVNHFMVVVGYTSDAFIVNSADHHLELLPTPRFEAIWAKRQHTTLCILPPGRATPFSPSSPSP